MDDALDVEMTDFGEGLGSPSDVRLPAHYVGPSDVRRFFQRQLPYNRRLQYIAAQRDARDEQREKIRRKNEEFAEIDAILASDEVMQWDLGEEFVHDAESWLAMQAEDDYVEWGNKRSRPDTLLEEQAENRKVRKWLHSKENRFLGYRPNTMGAGDYVYTGASVAEGYNIPAIGGADDAMGSHGPVDENPIPVTYDGVPVGGPPLPPGTGDIEMVEVEVGPQGPIVDDAGVQHGDPVPIVQENPFTPAAIEQMLGKTRENPFSKKKKKKVRFL